MAEHGGSPLEHVVDHDFLEIPWLHEVVYELPKITLPGGYQLQITRFMVMEVIAAVLLILILVPLARHVARNRVTKGPFLNAFEAMVVFIRDGIARPAIGGHGADHFLPYLWTVFFFVLFNNLMGMIPGGASPTGNINVTGVLALSTLGVVLYSGMKESGVGGFFKSLVPAMDVPAPIKVALWPLMFVIELLGLLIKHFVLAVRLFANMMAGHIVLAVILGFIFMASGYFQYLITPASIGGVVALSLLELFVAFLQAYIFTFLSALFIGTAVHPH
jgi:F-type H+-transporting ATPase subunit a